MLSNTLHRIRLTPLQRALLAAAIYLLFASLWALSAPLGGVRGGDASDWLLILVSAVVIGTLDYIRLRSRAAGEDRERHYAHILEMLPAGVLVLDSGGIITLSNPRAAAILGLTAGEMRGRAWADPRWGAIHEDGTPFLTEDQPSLISLRTGVRLHDVILGIQKPDGTRTWIRGDTEPLRRPGQPEPYAVVVSFTDITAERATAAALAASERQFRAVFDNAMDAKVILDDDHHVLRANSAADRLFGRPAEAMMAWTRAEPTFDANWAALLTQGTDHRDLHVPGPDGAELVIELRATANILPGQHLAVLRDVTVARQGEAARLALQTAEAATEAKSEFLTRLSHELRTPLNAILGFAQLLQMDEQPPGGTEPDEQPPGVADRVRYVGYIEQGGRHLLALINEELDIARVESGRLRLSIEPVEVREVVAAVLVLTAPLAARGQVTLSPTVPAVFTAWVQADRQGLQQVLLNLVSNAIKYNRRGGQVWLDCGGGAEPDRVRVSVRDTGRGIAPADLPRLFQPFERLDAAATGIEGSGLGLALSRRLVEAMGGVIGVDSTPGSGSTFWVDLPTAVPLALPAAALAPAAGATPAAGAPDSRPLHTLLYVENDVASLRLAEQVLRREPGVRVLPVMQGQVGLDLAREHRPNLVLLDLDLPDLAGDEVLAALQADPITRAIPVVVISADATPARQAQLRAAGAVACLTKPLDIPAMLAVVHDHLAPPEADGT